MRTQVRFISVLSLFLLSSALCRAEKSPVTENFASLAATGDLAFYSTNHIAKTDLAYYTCTSGAVFGLDVVNTPTENKKISINFSGSDQVMTTSAIEDLAGLSIYYYYRTSPSVQIPSLELRLSRDSVHWSNPIELSESTSASNTRRAAADFVPGTYFVRLTSKNSYAASVYEFRYSFGECNCFLYIPE